MVPLCLWKLVYWLGMPKVQAPDANPLASRASEPEARVEGSSFHAKPRGCAPAGNLTAPTKRACEPVHSSPKCRVHIRWRNSTVWRGTSLALGMSSRRLATACHSGLAAHFTLSSFRSRPHTSPLSFRGRRGSASSEPGIG